jgi:predicted metal-dependent peptidase
MDGHMPPKQSKEETIVDAMRAAEASANQSGGSGRGAVPSGIEAILQELKEPKLPPSAFIVSEALQKVVDAGNLNDWTRFTRRAQFIHTQEVGSDNWVPTHRLYTPKKKDHYFRWVCVLDTSNSMSDRDIANGVKELKSAATAAPNGVVVPCDAQPYWDKAVHIEKVSDIKNIKVAGRGGTVLGDAIREVPKRFDNPDLIIVITDGDCDDVAREELPAGTSILWIVVNKQNFKPRFGRVVSLE